MGACIREYVWTVKVLCTLFAESAASTGSSASCESHTCRSAQSRHQGADTDGLIDVMSTCRRACRWKDALVGCFKPGRYPHLRKTTKKKEGLSIYQLTNENEIPEKSILKPAMVSDVPRAMLPPDFDPDNPLVPLATAAPGGGGGAAFSPGAALPAPLNTDNFAQLTTGAVGGGYGGVTAGGGGGGGGGAASNGGMSDLAAGSAGGSGANLSLEQLVQQPGVTPDMIYAALTNAQSNPLGGF